MAGIKWMIVLDLILDLIVFSLDHRGVLTVPPLMCPGHQAMAGSLMPPSKVVSFPQRNGPLLPPEESQGTKTNGFVYQIAHTERGECMLIDCLLSCGPDERAAPLSEVKKTKVLFSMLSNRRTFKSWPMLSSSSITASPYLQNRDGLFHSPWETHPFIDFCDKRVSTAESDVPASLTLPKEWFGGVDGGVSGIRRPVEEEGPLHHGLNVYEHQGFL